MKQRPPAELSSALERYAQLVRRYHGTLDLLSGRGVEDLEEHLAEAEAYAELIAELSPAPMRLLDLGSGVGLPGVVVAARFPELATELVERRRRRAAFLSMAVAAVGAREAEVRTGDAQELTGPPVDVVTARAVGRLCEIYRLTRGRHAERVVLVSRRGPAWRREVEELAAAVGAAPLVVAAVARPKRGTLLAVRVLGGRPCPSSG